MAIESAGTQERGIEDVRTVRRRDNDDALVRGEAVHLHEELVERLLAFFVTERIPAATASDGIELVDEDDARWMAACVFE